MEKGRGIIPIVCFYVYNDEDSPIVCPGQVERKNKNNFQATDKKMRCRIAYTK